MLSGGVHCRWPELRGVPTGTCARVWLNARERCGGGALGPYRTLPYHTRCIIRCLMTSSYVVNPQVAMQMHSTISLTRDDFDIIR